MTKYNTEEERAAGTKDRLRRNYINKVRKQKGEPPLRDDEPTPQAVKKTPEEVKKRKAETSAARRARAPVFTCECGHTMKNSDGKSQHMKSDSHLSWMISKGKTPEERAKLILNRHTVRCAVRDKVTAYVERCAKIAEEIAMMQLEDKQ